VSNSRTFHPERLASSTLAVLAAVLAVMLLLATGCCSSPSPTHIKAEAKAWERIDENLPRWLDEDVEAGLLKPEEREAWNHRIKARQLRVKRALAAVGAR